MKRALVLMFTVIMIATFATTVSAVEIPQDGLIGWFKLDGNLKNEVEGGEEAAWIGNKFGEPLWESDEYLWYTGVDGYCWFVEDDGIRFLNPGNEGFTMAIWFMGLSNGNVSPILWYGQQDQSSGESWIGCWGVTVNPWEDGAAWSSYGPSVGSNNAQGTRPEIRPDHSYYDPSAEVPLPWTFVTITCVPNEDGETTTTEFYLNGEHIGTNTETPNPYVENYEEAGCYIYTSCNYWDPALNGFVDECIIYNRVLSADEIAEIYAAYGTPPTYDEMEEVDLYGSSDTEEPADTEEDSKEATEAPETSEASTSGEDTKPEEEKKKGGCRSVVTGAAAIVMTVVSVFGVAVIKRK
jgi:hypothetical protein